MSITDKHNKIKNYLGIDTTTILCSLIVIIVGVGSFGLGRLSMFDNEVTLKKIELTPSSAQLGLVVAPSLNKEKNFVASKNGKLYYTIKCSGALRIKPENEIWFSTREDAELSGYQFSTACK